MNIEFSNLKVNVYEIIEFWGVYCKCFTAVIVAIL
jgi:hypothetical protein